MGPLWLLSAWANSSVATLLRQGKGQEGRRRLTFPCPRVSYGYSYFSKRPVSLPSFPLCPVGRSTAAKTLSLLSGILSVVVLFLLTMDTAASPSFPPQLGKQEPEVSYCSRKGAQPQKPTRGVVFFFKAVSSFHFISSTGTKLLFSHGGISEGY